MTAPLPQQIRKLLSIKLAQAHKDKLLHLSRIKIRAICKYMKIYASQLSTMLPRWYKLEKILRFRQTQDTQRLTIGQIIVLERHTTYLWLSKLSSVASSKYQWNRLRPTKKHFRNILNKVWVRRKSFQEIKLTHGLSTRSPITPSQAMNALIGALTRFLPTKKPQCRLLTRGYIWKILSFRREWSILGSPILNQALTIQDIGIFLV